MAQVFSPTKLRALRKERGYSRMQLAFAVRRNVDQIGAWERGRDVPNYESITRLLHALDCRIEDLFEDSVAFRPGGGAGAGGSRLLAGVAPAPTSSGRAR